MHHGCICVSLAISPSSRGGSWRLGGSYRDDVVRLARKSESEYGSEYDTEFLAAEGARYGDAPRWPVCGAFTGMRRWFGDVVNERDVNNFWSQMKNRSPTYILRLAACASMSARCTS